MTLMGGIDSEGYKLFKKLFFEAMNAIRKRCSELLLVLNIMKDESDLECFSKFDIDKYYQRFQPALSDDKFKEHC